MVSLLHIADLELPLKKITYARLSVMNLVHFIALGSYIPIMSMFCKDYLGFSGTRAGIILACGPIAAVTMPWVISAVSDRLISAEKLYSACLLASGILLFLLSEIESFYLFFIVFLLYSLCIAPTGALMNTITFHNIPGARQKFPRIRIWGTIGWILAAWLIGFFWLNDALFGEAALDRFADVLKLGGIMMVIVGIFVFTFPARKVHHEPSHNRLVPIDSIRIFLRKEIVIVAACAFLVYFVDRFTIFGTAPFIRNLGYPEKTIMPLMSIGQLPEILAMFIMPGLMMKFGYKKVMLAGIGFEIIRFGAYLLGANPLFLVVGIAVHGLAYACFFMPLAVYLDHQCNASVRSGVHQILSFITSGISGFLGSLTAGFLFDMIEKYHDPVNVYTLFWIIPVSLSIIAFICTALFLKAQSPGKSPV
jgi:nucleoside transporter